MVTYELTPYERQMLTAMNDARKAWRDALAKGKNEEAERYHTWLLYYGYAYYDIH